MVAWAIRVGGPEVRRAAERAFAGFPGLRHERRKLGDRAHFQGREVSEADYRGSLPFDWLP